VPETVQHGETGLLVERRPMALAQALRSLLDDQALCQRLGERGRKYVCEMWKWSHAVDVLEQHLYAVERACSRSRVIK
jgi:phosphatidylinositol alpha-1,6-mannosyltransferase